MMFVSLPPLSVRWFGPSSSLRLAATAVQQLVASSTARAHVHEATPRVAAAACIPLTACLHGW